MPDLLTRRHMRAALCLPPWHCLWRRAGGPMWGRHIRVPARGFDAGWAVYRFPRRAARKVRRHG